MLPGCPSASVGTRRATRPRRRGIRRRRVFALAAHVDHAVDGRASTQHPAPRVDQRTATQPRFLDRAEHPVRAWVADAIQVSHRDVDPVVVIAPAGLQQQHPGARVLAQAVGQHAAGRPRAHDDDVVCLHKLFLSG
ncbi:hypothetical protein G6F46_014685 [Rhizopus delemar]|nr:hypothetical protein G6F46_014685 [Rhizopus delemar]